MSKSHPVRDLDKSKVSTVNAYLKALGAEGFDIYTQTNTVLVRTPWAHATKQSQRALGEAVYALEEHDLLDYPTVEDALQSYVEYNASITVDEYVQWLYEVRDKQQVLIDELERLPDSMATFYTKEEAHKLVHRLSEKIEVIEGIIREINDELDDLYIVVVRQHDAYNYHNKLGAYAE